jgi:hypothetical protein
LKVALEEQAKALREYADRAAQSASDKRFAKVREEVDKMRKSAEAVGVKFTDEQLRALQAKALLDNPPDPAADVTDDAKPKAPPQAQQQTAERPPQHIAVDGILMSAGMGESDPELRAVIEYSQKNRTDTQEFVDFAYQKAQEYRQRTASNGQQPHPVARMPSAAAGGAAGGVNPIKDVIDPDQLFEVYKKQKAQGKR